MSKQGGKDASGASVGSETRPLQEYEQGNADIMRVCGDCLKASGPW